MSGRVNTAVTKDPIFLPRGVRCARIVPKAASDHTRGTRSIAGYVRGAVTERPLTGASGMRVEVMFILVLSAPLVSGSVAATAEDGPASPPAGAEPADGVRRVTATLLGPVSDVRGADWPVKADGTPDFMLTMRGAVEVAILLPDGRTARLTAADGAFLVQFNRVVTGVSFRPSAAPGTIREAVADARRVLAEIGVEPDESMNRDMARWDGYNPRSNISRLRTHKRLREDIFCYVELRPTLEPEGWYLRVSIEALPPSKPSATRPATRPSSARARGAGQG